MHKKLLKTFVAVTTMIGVLSTSMMAFAAEDYTVQSGDSLKRIAKQSYGDETKWEIIYEANKGIIKNPNLIYKGQVFLIPDLTENETTSATMETTINEIAAVPSPEEIAPIIESNPTPNAAFEQYGLVCNAELNTAYPFVIPCYDTTEYTTAGKIIFSDYEVFNSDDTHEALEGYEWRAVTITVVFDDNNAYNYGYSGFTPILTDYYCDFANTYNESKDTYTLNYNGADYTDVQADVETLQSDWNGNIYTHQSRFLIRVPKGYDGLVTTVVRYDSSTWNDDAPITDKIDADTVFFRLK